LDGCTPFSGEGGTGSQSSTMWPGPRLPPCQVPVWSIQSFGHKRHGPKIGWFAPFWWGGAGFPSNNVGWVEAYLPTNWHLHPSSHLATTDMGRKLRGCAPLGGGPGFPSNTMWPGPRPACMPCFILICPTVWPLYTNVTDRQDKQRSDSIWRTVLQTVTQKISICR